MILNGVDHNIDGPHGIATDSQGNIYVTGYYSNNGFKITPSEEITEILNGNEYYGTPREIATDSKGNIYAIGYYENTVFKVTQDKVISVIINNDGLDSPRGITTDSQDNIYVTGYSSDNVIKITMGSPVVEPPVTAPVVIESLLPGGGGCNDCTPPTIGLDDDNKRLVDNGFSYNGNYIQVDFYHTEFPLINATVGEINLVEIKIYENGGIQNMQSVQFGLGAKEIGTPLSTVEVLINVELITDGTTTGVKTGEIIITDKNNLINNDSVYATSIAVPCQDTDDIENCIKVKLSYSYREATLNHVMIVNVTDKKHNTQNFYFNDGLVVLGTSQNPIPYYTLHNKHSSQQTENLTIILFETDKVNNIWTDGNGIEYLQVSEGRFDRITPIPPYQCNDPTLDTINVPTRNNCNFRALTTIWDY